LRRDTDQALNLLRIRMRHPLSVALNRFPSKFVVAPSSGFIEEQRHQSGTEFGSDFNFSPKPGKRFSVDFLFPFFE
jgi:hypothetical protein